ncbi:GNAT family N-acetyltransferase [Oricola cellulosilytica]|uniref:GNAT family N-acetyltransferase n=1 Tax=Oricola cellulosilytica TaxID=1429082 RepID=A0A4R0PCY8_9HYPH|nr:GNAT family N-acetyltransferase [Oricola cellulosilytica]TCD15342.1 GNAT family N-acetyltransferase [Oricola cellulosilytica]
MKSLHCRRATSRENLQTCLDIREIVFISEQGVDPALEQDGLDGECLHYLCEADGEPVATARVRILDDRFKFQRVAVLRHKRGTGVGGALMRFMMADLARSDGAAGRHFFLSSQTYAMPFYETLGFSACSGEYIEAGIPHRDMRAEVPVERDEACNA